MFSIEMLTKAVIIRPRIESTYCVMADKFLIFGTIYISMEIYFSVNIYWVSAKNVVLL